MGRHYGALSTRSPGVVIDVSETLPEGEIPLHQASG
ncbi:hypothetical protein ABIC80_002908 [Kosakonia sp. 1610]